MLHDNFEIVLHGRDQIAVQISRWHNQGPSTASGCDPRWLLVLRDGLGHVPYCIETMRGDCSLGRLPLALVDSFLFGRFLVSLPYVNSAGLSLEDPAAGRVLIDRAVQLADELDVRYLELRHEQEFTHPALTEKATGKVHMRLALPKTCDELWAGFKAKLRNQIRKGESQGFSTHWGSKELLPDFYGVFSHNMRDLGTPVFSRRLFCAILRHFPRETEMCVLKLADRPVAAALLFHGRTVTEVPSASCLRAYNSTNANMYMYWQLLQRAVERQQQVFDFGRSSDESNTYKFKKQWGAKPELAVWQYYLRRGQVGEMRPEHGKYHLAVRVWQRLPVAVTRWLGPAIVRGIP